MKSAVLFQSPKADGNHRHLVHMQIMQCFAQKPDVVRGTASPAGLKINQRRVVKINVCLRQCIKHLTDGANGGITHVVVDIFQPRVNDFLPVIFEHTHMVAVHFEHFL